MRSFALVLALVVALAAAACGGQEEERALPETVVGTIEAPAEEEPAADLPEGDAAAGEPVFADAGCGSCHTFAAAGSSGTVGPNLDEAAPSYEEAFETIANGRGGMPAFGDQLEEQQIADVAAYVSGG